MAMEAAATKFIPEVYAEGVEHDLQEQWVAVALCNRKYEGKIKKQGSSVTIRTAGRITAHSLTRDTKREKLIGAEEIMGDTITFPVDQIRYTIVGVDNIDEIATDVSLMNMSTKETARALAEAHDSYVNSVAYRESDKLVAESSALALTPKNISKYILDAKKALYKKNVSRNAKLTWVVDPDIEAVLVQANIITKTNNVEDYKNGYIGKVLGVDVVVSNNLYSNAVYDTEAINGLDGQPLMVGEGEDATPVTRTKIEKGVKKVQTPATLVGTYMLAGNDSLAFAEIVSKVKHFREDGDYLDMDFIKTYTLFDAKVIFPERIVGIPVASATLLTDITA